MDKLQKAIQDLTLDQTIRLEDIPNLDLYMDQVIQLFEEKYKNGLRSKEEKVLTKTMINNYAKGKLLFPIKNKKYSKEHLILISLIYQLKGSLSLQDIKDTLDPINAGIQNEAISLDILYNSYLSLFNKNIEYFNNEMQPRINDIKEEVESIGTDNDEFTEKFLLVTSLIHMSTLYRKVAEKIVDEIKNT